MVTHVVTMLLLRIHGLWLCMSDKGTKSRDMISPWSAMMIKSAGPEAEGTEQICLDDDYPEIGLA